jgi:CubicO group peptidase (beta-lactamase class C family)
MPDTSPSVRRRALQPAFDIARAQAEAGTAPFVILGVAGADGVVRLESFTGGGHPRIATDAVCLLASITKPIVATAVVQQVESGRIDLATPIGSWAPHLVNERWTPVTAWHVLTHTSGIDDIDLEALLRHGAGRADMLRHIAKVGQLTPPGSTFHYASFPFDVLAEALAHELGRPFEDVISDGLLAPLGMVDTTFDPGLDPRLAERAAPIVVGDWDGQTSAEDPGLVGAFTQLHLMGGGLWSTAADLLRFGRAMLRGGELEGTRILSPAFVELMTREVTAPRGVTWSGLGVAQDPQQSSHYAIGWGRPGVSGPASDRAFGHGGVSGTRLWIDPAHDLVYVYLTGKWGLPLAPIDAVEHAIYAALS